MGQVIQPADVRSRLREALEIDLVGPGTGHSLADERLPGWVRPSNWYLTGFLVPRGAPAEQRADADSDDDFEPEVAAEGGLGDDSAEDRRAAKKGFFPSSMGLSFLVAEGVDELDVTVRWGDYRYVKAESADDGEADTADVDAAAGGERSASTWWQRTARTEAVRVMLPGVDDARSQRVPGSRGLIVLSVARPVHAASFAGRIPPGTRSVSVFLVNERAPAAERARDEAFAFQAELEVRSAVPFVPRPDPRGVAGDDPDERVADLHYADTPEYAAGHGVAADWELVDGACRLLRTTWIPSADVEKTETVEVSGVELCHDGARRSLRRHGDAERRVDAAGDGLSGLDRRAGRRVDRPDGRAPRHGRGARVPRPLRRQPHRAGHPACYRRMRTRSTPSASRTAPLPPRSRGGWPAKG